MGNISGYDEFSNATKSPHCTSVLMHFVVTAWPLIIVIGFFGNTLTIIALLLSKDLHKSAASCYIFSLALADELFIFNLVMRTHYSYNGTWIFGKFMCKVSFAIYYLNMFASIFTMVMISIVRFIAVRYPLRSARLTPTSEAKVLCSCVWCVCGIITIPVLVYSTVYSYRNEHTACAFEIPIEKVWILMELILGFLIPTAVMVTMYGRLSCHLRKSSNRISNSGPNRSGKVTKMVVIVSAVFVLCWTPRHVMYFVDPTSNNGCVYYSFNFLAHSLEYVTSCCNPFIYWISSRKFRKMYNEIIWCRCICTRNSMKRHRALELRTTSRTEQTNKFDDLCDKNETRMSEVPGCQDTITRDDKLIYTDDKQ